MLALQVVDPGGSLSMLLLPHLTGERPVREGSWQVAVVMAAYSCNGVALNFWLQKISGGSVVVAAIVWPWILNFVIFFVFISLLFGLLSNI
jgi:hypothetical protein